MSSGTPPPVQRNRITPVRFIVGFGAVSGLADVVYEGARSVIGPFLGSLGAGAALVGLVTGLGEASALVLRLFTGRLSDRTGRPWPQTLVGYALTAVCVPLIGLTSGLVPAALLYNGERVGKAVRTPARDSMLAHASARMGRGYAFGLHELLDQAGAVAGPLLLAAALALGAGYRVAFALLAVPGLAAVVVLLRLRRLAPHPVDYEPEASVAEAKRLRLDSRLPQRFWMYAAFSVATMLGFSTWAVLAFHAVHRHLVSNAAVPVLYAVAMAAAAGTAVGFGRLYDRLGMVGLVALPPLAAVVPFLSFGSTVTLVVLGAVVWGAAMGAHESTMRAAVADLVPAHRRGAGFGTFTALYGLAWLLGSVLIGTLYERSVAAADWFVVGAQLVALALLVPLIRGGQGGPETQPAPVMRQKDA